MSWDMLSWQGTKPSSWKRWASRSRSWLCHTLPMIWSVPSSPRRSQGSDDQHVLLGNTWNLLICWTSLALPCVYMERTSCFTTLRLYLSSSRPVPQTAISRRNLQRQRQHGAANPKFGSDNRIMFPYCFHTVSILFPYCFHTVSILFPYPNLSQLSNHPTHPTHPTHLTSWDLPEVPSAPQPLSRASAEPQPSLSRASAEPEVFQHVTSEGWALRPRSWKSSRHWNWSVQAMAGHGTCRDHRALGKLR